MGLVLSGFSATLYLSAMAHLNRQVDDRLAAALAVMEAVAEVHPGGVEWETEGRPASLGLDPGPEGVRWAVIDEGGRLVDRSRDPAPRRPRRRALPAGGPTIEADPGGSPPATSRPARLRPGRGTPRRSRASTRA